MQEDPLLSEPPGKPSYAVGETKSLIIDSNFPRKPVMYKFFHVFVIWFDLWGKMIADITVVSLAFGILLSV